MDYVASVLSRFPFFTTLIFIILAIKDKKYTWNIFCIAPSAILFIMFSSCFSYLIVIPFIGNLYLTCLNTKFNFKELVGGLLKISKSLPFTGRLLDIIKCYNYNTLHITYNKYTIFALINPITYPIIKKMEHYPLQKMSRFINPSFWKIIPNNIQKDYLVTIMINNPFYPDNSKKKYIVTILINKIYIKPYSLSNNSLGYETELRITSVKPNLHTHNKCTGLSSPYSQELLNITKPTEDIYTIVHSSYFYDPIRNIHCELPDEQPSKTTLSSGADGDSNGEDDGNNNKKKPKIDYIKVASSGDNWIRLLEILRHINTRIIDLRNGGNYGEAIYGSDIVGGIVNRNVTLVQIIRYATDHPYEVVPHLNIRLDTILTQDVR